MFFVLKLIAVRNRGSIFDSSLPMPRFLVFLACILLMSSFASAADKKPIAKEGWLDIHSAHFEIITDAGEKRGVQGGVGNGFGSREGAEHERQYVGVGCGHLFGEHGLAGGPVVGVFGLGDRGVGLQGSAQRSCPSTSRARRGDVDAAR